MPPIFTYAFPRFMTVAPATTGWFSVKLFHLDTTYITTTALSLGSAFYILSF